jgi:hypothetical protein
MRREIWCFATALAALLSTAAADATPIEYSFSGTGDWTLNDLGGSGDFVVNLIADTSKIMVEPGEYAVLVSGTFSSGGSTVAFTEGGPIGQMQSSTGPLPRAQCSLCKFPASGRSRGWD